MVKSTKAEMMALHLEVFNRARYTCEWPGCEDPGQQLAHLTHRGMGGSKKANTPENCALLCIRHHDCLDGRTGLGTLRWELNEMLRYAVTHR